MVARKKIKPASLKDVLEGKVERPRGSGRGAIAEAGWRSSGQMEGAKRHREQTVSRLLVMFQITPSSFEHEDLIIAMAEAFVPGFIVREDAGRPVLWTPLIYALLLIDADREWRTATASQSKGKSTQRRIAQMLSQRLPWASMLGSRKTDDGFGEDPGAALLKHVQKAKKAGVDAEVAAMKSVLDEFSLNDDWEKLITSVVENVRRTQLKRSD